MQPRGEIRGARLLPRAAVALRRAGDGTQPADLVVTGNGSGFDVNLGATIVDNGAAVVNLVRRANVGAMNLFLSGVNTYTGKTFLGDQSGITSTLRILTERQLGAFPTSATADKLTISNGNLFFNGNIPASMAAGVC